MNFINDYLNSAKIYSKSKDASIHAWWVVILFNKVLFIAPRT